jgi:hypothetical protein
MNVLSIVRRICALTNDLPLIAFSIASDNSENLSWQQEQQGGRYGC